MSRGLQQRQQGKVGCDNPVTLDTAWKDTGLWLATTSKRMLNAPVSHWNDWDLRADPPCAMPLSRGSPCKRSRVPMAERFLLPTNTGTVPAALPSVGAGEQQCHPPVSSAAIGIVNVHSLFVWAKRHVG